MIILGLNAFHGDSAACLVRDGRLVAAAEEERFRRVKHWAGLPTEAIRYCLFEGGLRFSDLEHIAINRQPGVNNWRRLLFVLRHRPDFGLVKNRLRNIRHAASIEESLTAAFPGETLRAKVHHIEHHLAHLASAFLVSSFDEAVCVSVDGFGDFASAAWGLGRGNEIPIDGRVYFPHSLGIFYSAITQLLGFPHFGDEYKVMGLAPYGEPKYLPQMREIVRVHRDGTYELNLRFFRHHTENVSYTWNNCSPEVGTLYTPTLEQLLGPTRQKDQPLEQKHRDLARSAQAMYEEAFFALLRALYAKYQSPHLALSGGCAMNSVANGKVYLETPFKKMYLPAAAGDAGGAIGAAFALSKAEIGKVESRNGKWEMSHAYVGPQFEGAAIEKLLQSRGVLSTGPNSQPSTLNPQLSSPFSVLHFASEQALCARTAKAIAGGGVIGWFQGRMEWGPRALGNRSILCDPRRADMKEILNAKIKRRESFRPFAPSIVRERAAEWFEQDDDVPFMMEVFKFRPEKRALVPAVCHVDGSGRLQTVRRETNPLYHRLISEFNALTGVPMILNTSFNENEPVVCRPEEALDCFLRTKMDVLVLGNFFVERRS
jgi:carbamoyltransferase